MSTMDKSIFESKDMMLVFKIVSQIKLAETVIRKKRF